MQALVVSDMEWPAGDSRKSRNLDKEREGEKVLRLGYLRAGEKVPVIPEPHKKTNCPEGWYELVAGGYVCGKYITLDLNHPRFKLARAPDLSAALPYTYGVNNTQGTPLYRAIPSHEDRLKYEPWLAKPKKKKTDDGDDPNANPYAAAIADVTEVPDAGAPAPSSTSAQDSRPWYLRETDGGAAQVTLDELKEDDGPAAKRMVKGFFLSLDHEFTSGTTSWWKTNDGLLAPASSVWVTKNSTDFHGVWLDDDHESNTFFTPDLGAKRKVTKLPVGFVTSRYAKKWIMGTKHKRATSGGALHRWETVQLTGETTTIDGVGYDETDEGWWLRESDGTITEPGPPPDGLAEGEKWIDVNLKRQTLVAFVGDKPVFATIVSSGRQGHETPPGSFRIREKHISATMDGDADTASDGPYSIQDVPYIQYFNAGYALHGAFWHSEFGHTKSHGCVNLAPWDARALFGWTDPGLPDGWHGVLATPKKQGTRVVLHF